MDQSKAKKSSSNTESSSSTLKSSVMSNKTTKVNNNSTATIGGPSIFKLTPIRTVTQPKMSIKKIEQSRQEEEEENVQRNSRQPEHQKQQQQQQKITDKNNEPKQKKQREKKVHKLDETEFRNPLESANYFVSMDKPLKIVITEKISSSEFYFGCDSSYEFRSKLPKLENIMGNWYATHLIPETIFGDVKPNGIYVLWMDAQFCKRVRIMNDFDPSSSVVRVHLIDWGTFRNAFVEDLYPMRKKYMSFLPILSMLGKCDLYDLPEKEKQRINDGERVVFDAVSFFQRSKTIENHANISFKEVGVNLKLHQENHEVLD